MKKRISEDQLRAMFDELRDIVLSDLDLTGRKAKLLGIIVEGYKNEISRLMNENAG